MIINQKSKFEPAPAGDHRGVVVDVTPLKTLHGDYGDRDVFKLVFELEAENAEGKRYIVHSRLFTPSLHEKSAFRPFCEKVLGRKLTKEEAAGFDTESLLGIPVQMEIEQDETERGVFANIAYIKRVKDGALEPSGEYVRLQDREDQDEEQKSERQSEFRRTGGGGQDKPKGTQKPDQVSHPAKIKVHVGKFKGLELGDITREDIEKLIERWLDGAFPKIEKPTADDKRLANALQQYRKKFKDQDSKEKEKEEEDDVPMGDADPY